jgi:UDP-N-acetylmuramate dehydrogenase
VILQENVALAPLTTLGVGGRARWFTSARDEASLCEALAWARKNDAPALLLGGGSNLVVGDDGVDGLVVHVALGGRREERAGERVRLEVGAGESWDAFVESTVDSGLAGLECLSGIPGQVGATPIQNVGAYGVEIAEHVVSVRVLDRNTLETSNLSREECGFGYRDSVFKGRLRDRFVVLAVTFDLAAEGKPALRYPELVRALAGHPEPSLAEVRRTVLALRRAKGMVYAPEDPDTRSCGSFFVNPIVDAATHARVRAAFAGDVPAYPQADGRIKLSAAWLIQHAGLERGERRGSVGLSSKHTLAIVAHPGASAQAVLEFARLVRGRVHERFGVSLVPEPEFWGSIRGL